MGTMKEALKQVSSLVDRFQQNIEAYRNPAYNETQLRIEFIDPFFEAPGWDLTNKAQGKRNNRMLSISRKIKQTVFLGTNL
jgi:hypothetical protein